MDEVCGRMEHKLDSIAFKVGSISQKMDYANEVFERMSKGLDALIKFRRLLREGANLSSAFAETPG